MKQLNLKIHGAHSGALFDETRTYRWKLWRQWGDDSTVCWVMLNPSTADESELDPTIRRCLGFSRDWGFGRLEVVNLFALRSTDPQAIYEHGDPVGNQNDGHIRAASDEADLTVCAWGVHGEHLGRGAEVMGYLEEPHALRLTRDGHPGHPLYLPGDLKPFEIERRSA